MRLFEAADSGHCEIEQGLTLPVARGGRGEGRGPVEAEPGVYDTYAAPIAWEQVGLDVYVECPADKQIDASIHSIVVYYAPTL